MLARSPVPWRNPSSLVEALLTTTPTHFVTHVTWTCSVPALPIGFRCRCASRLQGPTAGSRPLMASCWRSSMTSNAQIALRWENRHWSGGNVFCPRADCRVHEYCVPRLVIARLLMNAGRWTPCSGEGGCAYCCCCCCVCCTAWPRAGTATSVKPGRALRAVIAPRCFDQHLVTPDTRFARALEKCAAPWPMVC